MLIVEDDRALARSLGRVLEQSGYSVRQVHDGISALEAVGKAHPDLILIDLLLPKKDGHSVISTLNASEATRAIPILAMSGVLRGADPAKSVVAAGARGFLEKPFQPAVLLDRITRLIGKPVATETKATGDTLDLAKSPAIEVLWSAMQIRTTGAVHFEQNKRHKVIVLDAGRPFAVRSNLAREALGRRLLDAGRIDEKVFNESVRRSKATGKRQGEVLIKMGAIGDAELREALSTQAADKMLEVFGWNEGRAWTQPGVRAMSLSSELEGWTPRQVVLRGVGRVANATIAQRLQPFLACEISQESLHLEEGENVDGVAALLQALSRPQRLRTLLNPHATTLYALWLIGSLELRTDGSGGTMTLPGVGAAAAASELDTKLREALERFEDATHFEVLNLPDTAREVEVRDAFMSLAKIYHPDKIGRRAPGLVDLAAKVFSRISEANDVLSKAETRNAYLAQVRRTRGASADRREVNRILTAEQQFQRAEEAMRRKDWEGSLECLRWALELDPNEGEFHTLRGWVMFLRIQERGGGDPEAAVEQVKKGIAHSPQSATGYYYLGLIKKACGDLPEAERMFRKTIEIRANHVEAARELRLMQLRRARGDDTVSGKLFGRKKK